MLSHPSPTSNKVSVCNVTSRPAFKNSGRQLRDELYIHKSNTALHQPTVLFACYMYLIPFTVFAGFFQLLILYANKIKSQPKFLNFPVVLFLSQKRYVVISYIKALIYRHYFLREDGFVDTRELFARLIQCEAGGEGEDGMKAVATVIMNRSTVPYGEFAKVSNGGDVRAIIEQPGQFVCMRTSVGGEYNPQNVYNISPTEESYEVADWALDGNLFEPVANSLFFMNPYSTNCPTYFPATGIGVAYNKIGEHCFYIPTERYAQT